MSIEKSFLNNRRLNFEAEAFLGPWRQMRDDDLVDPEHISTTDEGIEIIPARIYDKRPQHDFYDLQIFAADD